MTTSLARLMAEQKDKQRLENELAIAHEVQELLFPREACDLPTLEVHGVCRPARTVSGDYYDFIRLPDDRMVLAVGDISGKGISAALLMATVHAFVRAYSLEPDSRWPLCSWPGLPVSGDRALLSRRWNSGCRLGARPFDDNPELSALPRDAAGEVRDHVPGLLRRGLAITCLLQRRTPPSESRFPRRSVVRLETSGTVVGLFDGVGYGEAGYPCVRATSSSPLAMA